MMPNQKNIMLRFSFIILVMVLIGIAIICKAGVIMFAERQYWKDVADRFVKENVTVRPTRGNIISSDGQLMASSLPEYKIYMDFMINKRKGETEEEEKTRLKLQHIKDSVLYANLDTICKGLHEIFPDKSAAFFKQHIKNGRKKESRSWLLYPKRISYIQYKEAKRLPVFNLNKYKGGFHEQAFNQRKKPFGSLAMRTLGDMYPDIEQGAKNGLELSYDSILKGRNGITHRQKVMNKYLNIVDIPPVDGCDIITTIDVGMQDIAEKALVDELKEINATVGVAILMEVQTGDMMHGRYMKDHNWHRGGYGTINTTKSLTVSSNIGVSRLIDDHYHDNPEKFVRGLHRVGIATPLDLDIPGAGKPNIRIPNKDLSNWSRTALAWMSIGYETQIPPINTLAFYNAIANNGVMVKPRFVKSIVKDGQVVEDIAPEILNPAIASPKAISEIQTILEKVVSEGLGKKAGSKQFHVSGKTGTAQVSQGKAGYTNGTRRYLVSFCGYFPSEAPKYSCIVAIQKPGLPASGGLMAGSVFSKIAERVFAKHLAQDLKEAKDSTSILIPDVKNGDISAAHYVLNRINVNSSGVSEQSTEGKPVWGNVTSNPDNVLFNKKDINNKLVPSVIGMGAKDAVYLLESMGLKARITGIGKVKSQSIPAGNTLRKGQTIQLRLN